MQIIPDYRQACFVVLSYRNGAGRVIYHTPEYAALPTREACIAAIAEICDDATLHQIICGGYDETHNVCAEWVKRYSESYFEDGWLRPQFIADHADAEWCDARAEWEDRDTHEDYVAEHRLTASQLGVGRR
jgi:hypothetical protein